MKIPLVPTSLLLAHLACSACASQSRLSLPPIEQISFDTDAPPPEGAPGFSNPQAAWMAVDARTVAALAGDRSFEIAQSWLDTQSAYAEAEIVRREAWPSLVPAIRFFSLDGQDQSTVGDFVDVDKQNLELGAGLILEYNPAEARIAALAARQRADATAVRSKALTRASVLESQELFDHLLFAQLDLAIARELFEGARSVVEIARARQSQGRGLRADRLRAESLEAEAEGGVLRAEANLRENSILLAEHLRISPTVTLFAPEPRIEPLGLFDGELDLDALLEEAVTTRPEVAEALLRVEAAANELTGARLGPWVPSLFAYYEGSGFGENFGNLKDREELAVGLQWDLSPARFARSQLARLELQDEELALAHTRESIRAAATRYFEWVRIAAPLIEQAGRRVEASEEALSVVQERYEAGSALILEVIEVQRELALARRQWVRVTLDNNRSERRLAFAVGR